MNNDELLALDALLDDRDADVDYDDVDALLDERDADDEF